MDKVIKFENDFNIKFNNRVLFKRALTHSSFQHSQWGVNERLEFLGDAVVQIIITKYLYDNLNINEGKLSNIRSIAVGRKLMAKIAEDINIMQYSYLGKSEKNDIDVGKISVLSNLLEAIIGAIYIDIGYHRAKTFVLDLWKDYLSEIIEKGEYKNHKSRLQEYVQKKGYDIPEYELVDRKGPPHDRIFVMECKIDGKRISKARGKSKKEAELNAAKKAFKKVKKTL